MSSYDSSNISIFRGLDAVRKRPGMYIGNTDDGSGLHKMVFEVVDNSIDEFIIGECNLITVILRSDGYVTVTDNGRGMPIDVHAEEGISAAEVIMTVLHSGAKFNDESYKFSSGLHGVGVSVVNALSYKLVLRVFRSGFIYEQNYIYGKPVSSLSVIGTTTDRGTELSFLPDLGIFSFIEFNYSVLFDRFMELAFLNSGLKIILIDERSSLSKQDVFFETGGLKSFLSYLVKNDVVINKDIIFFSDINNSINISFAIQWVDSSKECILCYTNNILQKDGGSHLIGFKIALTKVLKNFIEENFLKKSDIIIVGEDIRDGLVVVLSIYMQNPKFSSQIKDKLISSEVRHAVEFVVCSKLKDFFHENPVLFKLIANRIISSAKARYAAKKAKDLVRSQNSVEFINLTGKLSDCQEKNPAFSEIFLVEGDSAGGSAKQARDRRTQAVLPLKGKILNVERSGFDKVLSSTELRSVLSALKCNVGNNDISNLRYNKIIFMTDADIDGAHIKTLLLTFFYKHLFKLIENKHVFIVNPPLYRFSSNEHAFYIRDKFEFNNFLFSSVYEYLSFIDFSFDFSFFSKFIFFYKDVITVLDNLSNQCPKIFFEKFIYFDFKIPSFVNDNFFKYLKLYESFFNKYSDVKLCLDFNFLSNDLLRLIFIKNGVTKEFRLNINFFKSYDYEKILEFGSLLKDFFSRNYSINFDGVTYDFYLFDKFFSNVCNKVLCRYVIQRYKGLGEMNPIQLWDTAMNPKTRSLKLIKIKDNIQAGFIFSNLMGENIEARKSFITQNITSSIDLDF